MSTERTPQRPKDFNPCKQDHGDRGTKRLQKDYYFYTPAERERHHNDADGLAIEWRELMAAAATDLEEQADQLLRDAGQPELVQPEFRDYSTATPEPIRQGEDDYHIPAQSYHPRHNISPAEVGVTDSHQIRAQMARAATLDPAFDDDPTDWRGDWGDDALGMRITNRPPAGTTK